MPDVDELFDPATGQRDPVALASLGTDPARDQSAEAAVQYLHDRVGEETDRVRAEVIWFAEAWKTAGDIVSRRLSEWAAAKDISAVGLLVDLLFVFMLENPAIRETMARMLRGASGFLGRLILQRKAKIAKIDNFAALFASSVLRGNNSLEARLNAARDAERRARTQLETLEAGILASAREELPRPPTLRGIPDRTPRFDFGASNVPNRARVMDILNQRHTQAAARQAEALGELESAATEANARLQGVIQEVNAKLAKDLARARKEVDLAQSVQRAIEMPEAKDYAVAAAKTVYKGVDPTGYGALAERPVTAGPKLAGRRSNIPIDVALVDAMKVVAMRLTDEMAATDRAAASFLRDALQGGADQFGRNYIALAALLHNLQHLSPAPEARSAEASLAAPQLEEERNRVIKNSEEILWAWVFYEPYFKPTETDAGLKLGMQYSPQFVANRPAGSDWPPPDAALDYLYKDFVAPADVGWLEDALDTVERFHRTIVDVLSLITLRPFLPDTVAPKQKTQREAEIIVHFRKLHDASLAQIVPKGSP
jgi:hypothetical protein